MDDGERMRYEDGSDEQRVEQGRKKTHMYSPIMISQCQEHDGSGRGMVRAGEGEGGSARIHEEIVRACVTK